MMVRTTPPVRVDLPSGLPDKLTQGLANWNKYPFYTAPSQVQEANQALALIRNPQDIKPSKLAGLTSQEIQHNLTIQHIDNGFVLAMEEYRKTLINATAADLAIVLTLRNPNLDFYRAVATGAIRLSQKTPDIPVIKHVIAPILSFFGAIWGICTQSSITQETVREERSVNREKWLTALKIKEEIRLKEAQRLIQKRVNTLHSNIQEAQKYHLQNGQDIQELTLLNKLIEIIAPGTSLQVNNKPILEYLKEVSGEDDPLIEIDT